MEISIQAIKDTHIHTHESWNSVHIWKYSFIHTAYTYTHYMYIIYVHAIFIIITEIIENYVTLMKN